MCIEFYTELPMNGTEYTDDETLGTISGVVGGGIVIIIIGGGISLLVIFLFRKNKSAGMYC